MKRELDDKHALYAVAVLVAVAGLIYLSKYIWEIYLIEWHYENELVDKRWSLNARITPEKGVKTCPKNDNLLIIQFKEDGTFLLRAFNSSINQEGVWFWSRNDNRELNIYSDYYRGIYSVKFKEGGDELGLYTTVMRDDTTLTYGDIFCSLESDLWQFPAGLGQKLLDPASL